MSELAIQISLSFCNLFNLHSQVRSLFDLTGVLTYVTIAIATKIYHFWLLFFTWSKPYFLCDLLIKLWKKFNFKRKAFSLERMLPYQFTGKFVTLCYENVSMKLCLNVTKIFANLNKQMQDLIIKFIRYLSTLAQLQKLCSSRHQEILSKVANSLEQNCAPFLTHVLLLTIIQLLCHLSNNLGLFTRNNHVVMPFTNSTELYRTSLASWFAGGTTQFHAKRDLFFHLRLIKRCQFYKVARSMSWKIYGNCQFWVFSRNNIILTLPATSFWSVSHSENNWKRWKRPRKIRANSLLASLHSLGSYGFDLFGLT